MSRVTKCSVLIMLILSVNLIGQTFRDDKIFDISNVDKIRQKNSNLGTNDATQGFDQYKNKNFSEAKKLYISALLNTINPSWYYELGDVLYELKEYENAIKSYAMSIDLNYDKVELSYYNIACIYGLMNNPSKCLDYLSIALEKGYSYKTHIFSDPDLNTIKQTSQYKTLLVDYFPPEIVDKSSNIMTINKNICGYSICDLNLDGKKDLAVLYVFPSDYGSHGYSYYMALYSEDKNQWKYVNKTTDCNDSIPEIKENHWVRNKMDLPYHEDSKILPVIINNYSNLLIAIPSWGSSYYGLKLFGINNEKIQEIGEIEGFERMYKIEDKTAFVGHYVTDGAMLDGTSKKYYWYCYDNNALLKQDNIPKHVYEDLENRKWNELIKIKRTYSMSELFWFMYKNNRSSINEELLNKMSSLVEDNDSDKSEITFELSKFLN